MKYWILLTALLCFLNIGCASANKKAIEKTSSTPDPKLLAPSVKKIWIPAAIKNGGAEWEEGHFLFKIERTTTWSR